ncbi:unnamed protein product, partial [Acanthoscelides obtectus]
FFIIFHCFAVIILGKFRKIKVDSGLGFVHLLFCSLLERLW